MLRVYDVRAGRVEEVRGAHRGELRMCVCGPGPAGAARVEDLRAYLVSDLIRRCAERRGRVVTVCQASTDVGFPAEPEADQREDAFRAGLAAVNVYPAAYWPRAAESVGLAIGLIAGLVGAGRARPGADGSVYLEGGRVLWQAAADGWEAPWANGVPSGDAVCPAVALHHLGERIDVHVSGTGTHVGGTGTHDGGTGMQRELFDAAAGREAVRHWVRVENGPETAGDSVGLPELAARGVDPLALRLAFLGQHYRRPAGLGWDALQAADKELRRWRERVADWARSPSGPMPREYADAVGSALDDDLDTPAALGTLRALERDEDVPPGARFEVFAHVDQLLGLDLARDIGRAGPA